MEETLLRNAFEVDLSEARAVLDKAWEALKAGRCEEALRLTEESRHKMENARLDYVMDVIAVSEEHLSAAAELGVDTKDGQHSLDKAKEAVEQGHFDLALERAVRSSEEIDKAHRMHVLRSIARGWRLVRAAPVPDPKAREILQDAEGLLKAKEYGAANEKAGEALSVLEKPLEAKVVEEFLKEPEATVPEELVQVVEPEPLEGKITQKEPKNIPEMKPERTPAPVPAPEPVEFQPDVPARHVQSPALTLRTPSERGRDKGRGRTTEKGLVNGTALALERGLTNGNGLVNGRGLVNGNGLVNGLHAKGHPGGMTEDALPSAHRKRKQRLRIIVIAVAAAVMLSMMPLLTILLPSTKSGLSIDGDFGDWSGKTLYDDGTGTGATSADLDIVRYGAARSDGSMHFYVKVAGRMLSGATSGKGVDTFNIFIDTDGNAATGYRLGGIGAERRLEIFGWEGIVRGSSLYQFSGTRGTSDWNGWQSMGGAAAAASGSELEASVAANEAGVADSAKFRILFQSQETGSQRSDLARALVGAKAGALVVSQVDTGASIVQSGQPVTLNLKMEALGRPMRATGITVTRLGNADLSSVGDVTVKRGGQTLASGKFTAGSTKLTMAMDLQLIRLDIVSIDIQANIATGAASGKTIGLALDGHDAVAVETGTTTVVQAALANHYIGAAPSTIVIDGAFADWDAIPFNADPAGDTNNSNIDIRDTRATKGNSTISFYVAVDGSLLQGAMTPAAKAARPGPPGPSVPPGPPGPVVEPPVLVGADTVKVFIDSDANFTTGSPFQGLMFGADYVLAVTGRESAILTRELFQWSAGAWKPIAGAIVPEAALAGEKMELQLPIAPMGITSSSTVGVYIQASDWRDVKDSITDPMVLRDPLQLNGEGEIYSSSDGKAWTYETDISSDTFVDLCTDLNTGYVYALANNGWVYESQGAWTKWNNIITYATDVDDFIAIATDSKTPYYYAIHTDGEAFITTNGVAWGNSVGDIGANTDYIDMCICNGTDKSAKLAAIRSTTGDTAYLSIDSGVTWKALGGKNVGDDGNKETNTGIVHGTGWNSYFYFFILQTDGDVRYDFDGNSANPWNSIAGPFVMTPTTWVDIAYETSSNKLWTITSTGKVYSNPIKTAGNPGDMSGWDTSLGTTKETGVVAIAVNEIPEFGEVVVPLLGSVVMFFVFRRRQRGRGRRRDM